MGSNKAFLKIAGMRLIDKTITLYQEIFSEIIIVANDVRSFLEFGNACIVADLYKDKGALGGLYTGLFFSKNHYSFVAACDMPFLNKNFISHLLDSAEGHDVIIPQTAKGLQPLQAVYSQRCLPVIRKHLMDNRLKVSGFHQNLRLLTVAEEKIKNFDEIDRIFFNINAEEDLKKINQQTQ